jgi:crotonobetainyl-CoA:carnitine CoA-transferase CaiB-like acyl-CoA transferase
VIKAWLADKTRAEAETILNSKGVPVGSVYTARDVFEDPQVKARKILVPVDDPDVGVYRFARSPVMLSSSPEPMIGPAPRLGEHTHAVMRDILGYSVADIEGLEAAGVI